MTSPRLRLASRLAALERFKEERLRQELAGAHHEAQRAKQHQQEWEVELEHIEDIRLSALRASKADLATYGLYTELSATTEQRLRVSMAVTVAADEMVEQKTVAWKAGNARYESSRERSDRLADEAVREDTKKHHVDAMDLWLAQRMWLS
ncbi:hypothetical protein [Dyella silvatica]|uniref:hypothetical protein n=1 Tax=Dyella silvatica TaxID=2992128 RepID=UPI00225BC498|nr:hypothetical protein [Dyella silvatica]